MGKTKKLYLARRMLAMILAAAMSVTMIPSTALAVSAGDGVVENIVDADTAAGSGDVKAPEDGDGPEGTGGIVSDGDAADGAGDDASDDGTANGTDGSADAVNKDADDAAADGSADEGGKKTDDTDKVKTNAEGDAPAAQSSYKITLTGEFETKAVYAGQDKSSPFADIKDYVTLTKDGEEVTDPTEMAKITLVWKQKGEDGNYTDIAGNAAPINAGTYQAVLGYPKQDGVHDGAELTVDCEIAKASVEITLNGLSGGKLSVKPGTKKSGITMPTIDRIVSGNNELDPATGDVTLAMEIKNAVTGAVLDDNDVLTKDGDYCMALTPSFKDGLPATKTGNQDLKPFTVDIVMEELIRTQVVVTLADKHKQEGEPAATQITKEYDGNAIDPKEGAAEDYTVKVQYYDETAGDYKDLTSELAGGEVKTTGEWRPYTGCEVGTDGKVVAPVNAGTYTYKVVYAGKDGVYAASEDYVTVEITKAELKVEPVYDSLPLEVPENITAQEVLAKVDYKVTDKADKDVTAKVKAKHIWGTSYDDDSMSQIYEPLFTLQESADGTSWADITQDDRDFILEKDGKYRIAFTGRKVIFYADGSYYSWSVQDDINDDNYGSINGVDTNYHTTAAEGKELAVQVKAGAEAEIDVSGLLGEQKGARTIAALNPKEYDGAQIYTSTSQYKNAVKLRQKTADGTQGTEIPTEQREFTYTWERYKYGDRFDAQLAEANGSLSEYNWSQQRFVSPRNAGVYRLTISYTDRTDPATYNYADDVTVYFAIDQRQVVIEPKDEPYEILEGRSIWDFFHGEKKIEYTARAVDGKDLPRESVIPHGQILRRKTANPSAVETAYGPNTRDSFLKKEDGYSYTLQGAELVWEDDYSSALNYTCYDSRIVDGKRVDTFLNTVEREITVVPLGTQQVTITVDPTKWTAKEKVYDAKPFAETDLVPAGLVSVKGADGAEITGLKLTYTVPYTDEDGNETDRELKDVVEAGSYDLYVRFDGDKTYAPVGWNDEAAYPANLGLKVGTFKITKREIALTADLDESYKAGTYVSDILDVVRSRYQVTGYVKGQEEAFADKYDGGYLKAWGEDAYGPSFYVTEEGSNDRLDEWSDKLKRDKTYVVRYDSENSELTYDRYGDSENKVEFCPANDYTVKNAPVATFKAVKGNSKIESVDYDNVSEIAIRVQNDKADPMKREVTMTEAIRWSQITLNGKEKEGNLVAFEFTAPAEYDSMPATAMYENAIKAAGGYVIPGGYYSDTFTAVFDAADGDKMFKLRWEDGYVETYTLKFAEAVKLANLEDAVAPKALSFNAPDKKMAVGQEQQLDVKITKEQMGDVIYLGYESDDPKTLVVDKNGKVTALKAGSSATVTVFPQHLVNGKPKRIEGAKVATLKIQVTKLDAPKKVKATVHGNYISLDYDSPAYGYRREIYVVKKSDKFKKADDFETTLKDMKANQWKAKGFAVAPVYLDEDEEKDNREWHEYTAQIDSLDVKTDYTVYVRNVCAVRTLTDGTGGVITQAAMNGSASGVVVNVKTKKAEVEDLDLSFYDSQAWVYDGNDNHVVKYSLLKNGTIECWTEGSFPEYDKEKDILSSTNNMWVKLPFAGQDKANYKDIYEEPKLEYALDECYDKKTGTWGWGTKNDYASIDKKGKIKITGLPPYDEYKDAHVLRVRVRDAVTGVLTISALPLMLEDADAVTAAKKSVTLSVGQGQNLEDLLTYSLGRTKFTAYPNRSIDLAKVRSAIKDQNQTDFFKVTEYGYVVAINGGGTLNLELTDTKVEKRSGTEKATATVTIKSKDLEPVKGLKACDVTHNRFGLTFSYTGGASQFLLEVSDAKKPIYSKVLSRRSDGIQDLLVTDKDGKYVQVRNAAGELMTDDDGYPMWACVKDTYEIPYWYIEQLGIRLTKDSQYTVSLTPVYGANKAAKAATVKVKTTKIPAQDWYFGNEIDEYGQGTWACEKKGGMSITVSEYNRNLELSEDNTSLYAVSGNTYTLTANVQYNQGRVNDTLVWTVGDTKVAKVKAAAGTYCITLTGVKPGKTTLEVRSKLLGNKVIARYDIEVEAVKNAYDNSEYYGENEPE